LPPAEIRTWLVQRLADELSIPLDQIHPSESFERHGIDSVAAVSIVGDLEIHLDRELDAALLLRCPTIDALVEFLSNGDADSLAEAPL
jgi:acyl carrier protein